ncbi:hypothetical protein FMM75_15265 [Lachnospiraceae bacterium MD335]|nr:hypothetical protein [Lachnospiraceae bacterium MD335]
MENEQMKKELDYIYLVNKYKKVIESRYDHLEIRAKEFIKKQGYSDVVILNHSMLNIMIIDYFADIDRLKEFHDIEHANKNKITAYTVYWWLRRRPLQVITDQDNTIEKANKNEKLVYVNEEFATSLIIKDIFNLNIDKDSIKNSVTCKKYIEYVFYYLKYRVLDAKAIEWVLASAEIGQEIGKIQVNN